ncbi:hypothetical protein [Companilactobacillus ginsenosidimutans]|uniref:Uncharacterized protein n=1 Tax=Companilactobacillus ginsenosidimutans TaxID=1007676 RepID=A0A0H4QHL6_9LACO|nr:hypothetical protein [Companilactobacillus ginsenosidimutans]AKP67437.1 hypothetical protein ABM34_07750 [Companilactobacillus ginsenosidimutans]
MGSWGSISDFISAIATVLTVYFAYRAIRVTQVKKPKLYFEVVNNQESEDDSDDNEGYKVVVVNSGDAPAILNRKLIDERTQEKYINDTWQENTNSKEYLATYTPEAHNSVIVLPGQEKKLIYFKSSFYHRLGGVNNRTYKIRFDEKEGSVFKFKFRKDSDGQVVLDDINNTMANQ